MFWSIVYLNLRYRPDARRPSSLFKLVGDWWQVAPSLTWKSYIILNIALRSPSYYHSRFKRRPLAERAHLTTGYDYQRNNLTGPLSLVRSKLVNPQDECCGRIIVRFRAIRYQFYEWRGDETWLKKKWNKHESGSRNEVLIARYVRTRLASWVCTWISRTLSRCRPTISEFLWGIKALACA